MGGKEMRYVDRYSSPLGWITLAADGAAITGLWFEGQKYAGDVSGYRQEPLPVFDETKRWLDVYFRGADPGPVPPLAPAGTAFRQAVWGVLAAIPYGQTMTYGQISRILAQQRGSSSPRAVGSAVAAVTTELRLENRILYVRVRSSVIRSELFYQREALRDRINELAKIKLVNAVIIR